jgi:hypothetical protein
MALRMRSLLLLSLLLLLMLLLLLLLLSLLSLLSLLPLLSLLLLLMLQLVLLLLQVLLVFLLLLLLLLLLLFLLFLVVLPSNWCLAIVPGKDAEVCSISSCFVVVLKVVVGFVRCRQVMILNCEERPHKLKLKLKLKLRSLEGKKDFMITGYMHYSVLFMITEELYRE